MEDFPEISSRGDPKLRELSDLLQGLQSAKAKSDRQNLSFLDTAKGVTPSLEAPSWPTTEVGYVQVRTEDKNSSCQSACRLVTGPSFAFMLEHGTQPSPKQNSLSVAVQTTTNPSVLQAGSCILF